MSGENVCDCDYWHSKHRWHCSTNYPTPVPSEVAETTAGEREVNIIQRIVNAWDCCGTCAGGVLAAHDRATADRVRREEGERIAQAIENDPGLRLGHDRLACSCLRCDVAHAAARIARSPR